MAEYTVAVFTVVDVRAVRAVAVFTDSAVIAVKAFIQLKFPPFPTFRVFPPWLN